MFEKGVEAIRAATARRYCIFIRRGTGFQPLPLFLSAASPSTPFLSLTLSLFLCLVLLFPRKTPVKVARGGVNDDAITAQFRFLFSDNSIPVSQPANRLKRPRPRGISIPLSRRV